MLHFAIAVTAALVGTAEPSSACDKLTGLFTPGVTVIGAETIGPGAWKTPGGKDLDGLPATCRLSLRLSPSTGSSIQAEVWLPLEGWNGRFLGTGNGGYGGVIDHGALANGVARGFATANDDTGTAPAKGRDGSPLIGQPVRWLDFGWRATHTTAAVGKQMVAAFYGKPARHSYFVGCSAGGRQALMEAQRFPEDYDGIVAGCAARQQTRTLAQIVWLHRALRATPESLPTPEKLQALRKAVLAACGPTDSGPSGDAWLVDPAACTFDPATIRCKEGDGPDCLSDAQVEAVRKIYAGSAQPADRRGGACRHPAGRRGDGTVTWGPSPARPSHPGTGPSAGPSAPSGTRPPSTSTATRRRSRRRSGLSSTRPPPT